MPPMYWMYPDDDEVHNETRRSLVHPRAVPVVVIPAEKWRRLVECVNTMEAFCCDGVVAWSLLTKERLGDVQEQMKAARTIIASVEVQP